jgi:glycosyltransferase involved in cell wall biosynthesis
MKVLIAHSRYLSGGSSGENRVVEDECALLRSGGHDVFQWCSAARQRSRLGSAISTTWSRAAYAAIHAHIQRERIDLIHLHNLFPAVSPAAIYAARREQVPVVLTLHNFRLTCLAGTYLREEKICESCKGRSPLPGVFHGCYRGSRLASGAIATSLVLHRRAGTFRHVNRFIAVSNFVREKYIEAGFDPQRVIVKPNFAPATPRRAGPGKHFLYMGRLSPEKGVARLVGRWPLRHDTRLIIAGAGPDSRRIARLCGPNVEVLGEVDPGRLSSLLRHARAVVVPSICYEGAPRAVLESYAAGVPVLASAMGALPEFVEHGRNGLVVEPSGPDWARAVERLLEDDESVLLGGGAYRTWKDEYAPARALQRLEAIYSSTISRTGRRSQMGASC